MSESGGRALTRDELAAQFRRAGVDGGDTLLVHSRLKALGPVDGGPATVRDALLAALAPAGTLIVPTFNFGFCEGQGFDARATPSKMGALTEVVRTDPRAARVAHPIYSFSVLGARADECAAIRNVSAYGRDSVFGRLRDWDGKILVIGLTYNNSMTFFHHVEEMEGCDYRYMKSFSGPVTDGTGTTRQQTATMLVRDLDRGVVTAVDPMGAVLEREGIAEVSEVGQAKVVVMRANAVYESTARHLAAGERLLYVIEP